MLFNTISLHECEGKVLTSQAETNYPKSRKPKKIEPERQLEKRQSVTTENFLLKNKHLYPMERRNVKKRYIRAFLFLFQKCFFPFMTSNIFKTQQQNHIVTI